MSFKRPARLLALLAAASLLASMTLIFSIAATGSQKAAAATVDSSVSKTEKITRDHMINGVDSVVDTRDVSVKVDATQALKDRQGVHISWSGAHPTGGIVYDNTSQYSANQEYPVAILQCRGVDSTTVPVAQRLAPETCYTQTPEQRYQPPYLGSFPAYRVDRYASPAARQMSVGTPNPLPAACPSGDGAQHWVPFKAVDGTSYYGGSLGCAGLAPEQSAVANPLNPASTTFGTTGSDGTGAADFIVQNADGNASLGCSATVACAIVIIPIMGVSCDAEASSLQPVNRPTDPAAAQQDCGGTGFYQPGQPGSQNAFDTNSEIAVNGQLWWTASNWRNRITVPISMAQTSSVCDVTGGGTPENVYGSQYLVQLTQQWAPKFCLDPSLFRLQQVQTSEVQAKNLLANGVTNNEYLGVKAVFQAGPPAAKFQNPIVQAPTAVSGFAIAYRIDDAKHHEYTQLKLNARLLAKLMTMSYPALPIVRDDWATLSTYQASSNNPLDIAVDPEFLALNPGADAKSFNQLDASATLFTMSSDSDVMTALTSYINADPEARAFLDGQPDPWGMVVNPNYKKITLPVTSWPQLDNYYNPLDGRCIADGHFPILPLIAGPVSDPSLITFNMQYGISNSQTNCVTVGDIDSPDTRRLTAEGRQDPGIRFLMGVVGLGDAARYQLPTAALQSQESPTAAVKFSDAAGRSFVAPTSDSLLAAAKLLQPDNNLNTWTVPYDKLRTEAGGVAAYPGTLLMSTDVPTAGLTSADAANFAKLLNYAAGPGQIQGVGNGQLPDGYLPITTANGLGNLVDYTKRAAAEVVSQKGRVPSLTDGAVTTPQPSATARPSVGSVPGVGGTGNAVTGVADNASAASGSGAAAPQHSLASSAQTAGKSSSAPNSSPIALRPAGSTRSLSPGWLGYAVPALASIGLASAFASVWLSGVGRRR
ncbi:MAG TPA: hypothetical protein VGH11_07695 [Jatrophihabitans sp.]